MVSSGIIEGLIASELFSLWDQEELQKLMLLQRPVNLGKRTATWPLGLLGKGRDA